jgi:hypothetical protein
VKKTEFNTTYVGIYKELAAGELKLEDYSCTKGPREREIEK